MVIAPCGCLCSAQHLEMYEMVGRVMGMAIRTRVLLALDLPSMVWKQLCGRKPNRSDLRQVSFFFVGLSLRARSRSSGFSLLSIPSFLDFGFLFKIWLHLAFGQIVSFRFPPDRPLAGARHSGPCFGLPRQEGIQRQVHQRLEFLFSLFSSAASSRFTFSVVVV